MLGRAMPTIETSSPSRKSTPQRTSSAAHPRRLSLSVGVGMEFMPRKYMQWNLFP